MHDDVPQICKDIDIPYLTSNIKDMHATKRIFLIILTSGVLGSLGCQTSYISKESAPAFWGEEVQRGKHLYDLNCASCHGKDADGKGNEAHALAQKPANLIRYETLISMDSLGVHIQVSDHSQAHTEKQISTGNQVMPAWEEVFQKEDIQAIASYIQYLRQQQTDQ